MRAKLAVALRVGAHEFTKDVLKPARRNPDAVVTHDDGRLAGLVPVDLDEATRLLRSA